MVFVVFLHTAFWHTDDSLFIRISGNGGVLAADPPRRFQAAEIALITALCDQFSVAGRFSHLASETQIHGDNSVGDVPRQTGSVPRVPVSLIQCVYVSHCAAPMYIGTAFPHSSNNDQSNDAYK